MHIVLRVALVVLVPGLLSGCEAIPQVAAPVAARHSASPAPLPELSYDDLVEALPAPADLDRPWQVSSRCVYADWECARMKEGGGRAALITATGTRVDDTADYLVVGAVRWPDAAAAANAAVGARDSQTEQYAGRFRHPITDKDDGYVPGRLGNGRVEDFVIGGWRGFRREATFRYLKWPSGSKTRRTTSVMVLLAWHRYTVQVEATGWRPGSAAEAVDQHLDRLLAALAKAAELAD